MAYAGIIFRKDDRFLLQLRDSNIGTKNPDQWGIFGGGIEYTETPGQAILREIKEEIGIQFKLEEIKLFAKTRFRGEECYVYRANFPYEISNITLNEGKDLGLFTKEEVLRLNNTIEGLKELIISV